MSSNIPTDALHDPNAPFNQEERESRKLYASELNPIFNELEDLVILEDEIPDLYCDILDLINRYNIEK